jgi:hypothetical protein
MKYLAVLRTNLDELPLLLTDDRKSAERECLTMDKATREKSAKLMGVDLAGVVCSAIITFGANGRPKKLTIVADIEEQEDGSFVVTKHKKMKVAHAA